MGGGVANWPADSVTRRPVAELSAFERNSKRHPKAQIDALARSIERWGFTMPVLVDEAGVLIAGHARLEAAQKLGLESVPVIEARGWSDEDRAAYVIADNRLGELGAWDRDVLRQELQGLSESEFDLELLGFKGVEIDDILAGTTAGRTGEPLRYDETVSAPGTIWQLGHHRVMCGDATDGEMVARLMDERKPGLMVTDPPYGVEYDPNWRGEALGQTVRAQGLVENDDCASWTEAWRHFAGDVVYCWHGALHAAEVLRDFVRLGFELRSQIIWAKSRATISRGHYHWQHEPCFYLVRKGRAARWSGTRKATTLWDVAEGDAETTLWRIAGEKSETTHSTQKPVECMARGIRNNSRRGDYVYDPFLGSGTTLIAAHREGRRCLGMEIVPAYADQAVLRWAAETGEEPIEAASGATFSDLRKEQAA